VSETTHDTWTPQLGTIYEGMTEAEYLADSKMPPDTFDRTRELAAQIPGELRGEIERLAELADALEPSARTFGRRLFELRIAYFEWQRSVAPFGDWISDCVPDATGINALLDRGFELATHVERDTSGLGTPDWLTPELVARRERAERPYKVDAVDNA
jgi:hypothetical protein